jgi:hypothetical protein
MASIPPRRPRAIGRLLLLVVLLLLGLPALWTWFSLSWSYADGERAGVLQKFVRRGWVCKTYEGEIALYYGGGQYLGPASSAQLWDFSVRDPVAAAELTKAVGHRVQLHYTEHKGIPTDCFADTRYFVDRVTVVDKDAEPATPAAPASPGTPAPGGESAPVAPGSAPVNTPPVEPAPGTPTPRPPPAVSP